PRPCTPTHTNTPPRSQIHTPPLCLPYHTHTHTHTHTHHCHICCHIHFSPSSLKTFKSMFLYLCAQLRMSLTHTRKHTHTHSRAHPKINTHSSFPSSLSLWAVRSVCVCLCVCGSLCGHVFCTVSVSVSVCLCVVGRCLFVLLVLFFCLVSNDWC